MTAKLENQPPEVKLVDDLADPIPRACDNATHMSVNELRDALEAADFANGFADADAEDDWTGEPPSPLDVLFARYLYALGQRDAAEPIPDIDVETAWKNLCRAEGEESRDYYVTRRRRAEATARYWRALHIWAEINRRIKKEQAPAKRKAAREYIARNGIKRRAVVNGYVRTGKTKLIDGVRVPVVERVRP